jgi:hypothetical protein
MNKSFRSILVVKDKSSKILLGSSSASSIDVAAKVGVVAESEAQSSADVDAALLCGTSRHSDGENLQLPVGVVYNYGGSHCSSTWLSSIGGLQIVLLLVSKNRSAIFRNY